MATITKYSTAAGDRYRVRYRKPDGKQTDKRGFKTQRSATAWAAENTVAINRGEYVAPSLGRETIGALGPKWLKLKKGSVKPATYDKLDGAWRNYVEPVWADTPVAKVTKSSVQIWANEINKSPTVKRRAVGVLAGILDLAVDDGLIIKHAARDVDLPRKGKGSHAYLTAKQLQAFLKEIPAEHKLFVRILAGTGMRYGEAAALNGRHIDRSKQRIRVEQTMFYHRVEQGKGKYDVGAVKTWEARTVSIAKHILDDVPLTFPNVLAFPTPSGEMRPYLSETSYFAGAVKRCQAADATFPKITPHDLRHTYASLAVAAGANVKALSNQLGHASAAMTLDVYADLFDADMDAVATAIGKVVA